LALLSFSTSTRWILVVWLLIPWSYCLLEGVTQRAEQDSSRGIIEDFVCPNRNRTLDNCAAGRRPFDRPLFDLHGQLPDWDVASIVPFDIRTLDESYPACRDGEQVGIGAARRTSPWLLYSASINIVGIAGCSFGLFGNDQQGPYTELYAVSASASRILLTKSSGEIDSPSTSCRCRRSAMRPCR
jgi:hypothetical protein